MILHGYTISEAALLEVEDPYALRALVQHNLLLTSTMINKATLVNRFETVIKSAGFPNLVVKILDLETAAEADEYDDDLVLMIDTDRPHHVTVQ